MTCLPQAALAEIWPLPSNLMTLEGRQSPALVQETIKLRQNAVNVRQKRSTLRILPFHRVRTTTCQAKDTASRPLPSPEDWSKDHSTAERSWPAGPTTEVRSTAGRRRPDPMSGDRAVGQTARSNRQTGRTGCNARLSSRATGTFPLQGTRRNHAFA